MSNCQIVFIHKQNYILDGLVKLWFHVSLKLNCFGIVLKVNLIVIDILFLCD